MRVPFDACNIRVVPLFANDASRVSIQIPVSPQVEGRPQIEGRLRGESAYAKRLSRQASPVIKGTELSRHSVEMDQQKSTEDRSVSQLSWLWPKFVSASLDSRQDVRTKSRRFLGKLHFAFPVSSVMRHSAVMLGRKPRRRDSM